MIIGEEGIESHYEINAKCGLRILVPNRKLVKISKLFIFLYVWIRELMEVKIPFMRKNIHHYDIGRSILHTSIKFDYKL